MNYVTKNDKITKVQIEKIRKKLYFCQWFLFFFFPIPWEHYIPSQKWRWMEQKGDKKSKREEKDGRNEGRKGKKLRGRTEDEIEYNT